MPTRGENVQLLLVSQKSITTAVVIAVPVGKRKEKKENELADERTEEACQYGIDI